MHLCSSPQCTELMPPMNYFSNSLSDPASTSDAEPRGRRRVECAYGETEHGGSVVWEQQ